MEHSQRIRPRSERREDNPARGRNVAVELRLPGGLTLNWLHDIAVELTASLSDGRVWVSILVAPVLGAACLLLGTWVARRVGLLDRDAPVGETIGVGLGSGLLILAAAWAAIFSGGRSAFTPVALGFAISIALILWKRPRAGSERGPDDAPLVARDRAAIGRALLASGAFVLLVGLLYGSTVAPSPRDSLQPVEFMDTAYYAVLGRDLAQTGTETIYSPSGFDALPDLPFQTWYHWGELWLSAIAITLFGLDPLFARHYVVLPLLMLAAAALTGTLVRRMGGTPTRRAFLFGAAASLFLAPVPIPGPFFAYWARGLIFGITVYGLGAIVVLLVLLLMTRRPRVPSTATAVFYGSVIASVLPAQIVIAILGLVGLGGVLVLRGVLLLRRHARLTDLVPVAWRGTAAASGLLVLATIAWGIVTGHGIGASGLSESVSPFNDSWRQSVVMTTVGGGVMLAIPVAWLVVRTKPGPQAWVFLGTGMLLVAGALAWGARLGDFNMFHVFYGGIAVFATPAAAVAAAILLVRLRESRRLSLAAGLVVLCAMQLGIGIAASTVRLQTFGPRAYEPIAVSLLAQIRQLPAGAKLAYACQPFEEVSIWDPRLVSIDAHTGKRIVPMCFQAAFFGLLTGTPLSPEIPSPLFAWAPQRAIYPDSDARPSSAVVEAFLKGHGIDYIYADRVHPNSLVSNAIPVFSSGDAQVLRLP